MIDLHCHILPDLDDGAGSLDEAVEMARIAERDGIEKIAATPHLFRDNFVYEDLGTIEERRRELSEALKVNKIQVELFPGAEAHISHNLIDEIKKTEAILSSIRALTCLSNFLLTMFFLVLKSFFSN